MRAEIAPRFADALGLTALDRLSVARRLAEIGGLPPPGREETVDFLVEVLMKALRQIPTRNVWSWGEFHNGGIQPLADIGREEDWHRSAVCAVDLGLDAQVPRRIVQDEGELTPRTALGRNLLDAVERLLEELRDLLRAAGIEP